MYSLTCTVAPKAGVKKDRVSFRTINQLNHQVNGN